MFDVLLFDVFVVYFDVLVVCCLLFVVILLNDGSGDVWSVGYDLCELVDDCDLFVYGKLFECVLWCVWIYFGVVIVVVVGLVWGGVVDLVMSCDFVVVVCDVCFVMMLVNIGLLYLMSGLLCFYDNLLIYVLKEMFFCV